MKKLIVFPIALFFASLVLLQAAKAEEPARQQSVEHVTQTKTYQRIKNAVDQIWIIDTHEHLRDESRYLKKPADFLCRMLNYTDADLRSAGMAYKDLGYIKSPSVPLPERWKVFQKYWKESRFTGYSRALHRTVKDLYDIDLDQVTPETAHLLNEKIAATSKPGVYRDVLEKKARIDLSIVDLSSTKPVPGVLAKVKRFDRFVNIHNAKNLEDLAKRTGVKIDSLEDLCRALEVNFEKEVKSGIVGIKSALAYNRRIYYPLPTEEHAKAAFEKAKSGKPVSYTEILPLQNYMMHQVCKLADKHDMPFQFHTGLQTGSGNTITNSKPTDLVNLIMAYPNVKFVIFHGSYPYGHELSTIAKNFRNAYIDMCWLPIISPKISRDSLSEWLETVPANKINVFGGDQCFPEGVYGHAEVAREVVAEVLAEKVLRGYMTEADACELAVKLLRNNAIELYQLKLPKATAKEVAQ